MPVTGKHLSAEQRAEIEAALQANPIASAVSRLTGIRRGTVERIAREMRSAGRLNEAMSTHERGQRPVSHRDPSLAAKPRSSRVYLCTAAQDSTPHHDGFWRNLLAYAAFRDAEVIVGGFTYQKGLFQDHAVVANVYDRAISPYLKPEKIELAPGLVWCGHANILPTAAKPTTGWDTLTGDKWGLIPHAKIRLDSIPVMPGSAPKQVITTGVVTIPNYVQRAAGQKADFHHTIGASIVEVDPDGKFWVRQISATKDGSFQDLDIMVADEKVSTGNRVEAITWGDIHHEKLDPDVAKWAWGMGEAPGPIMLDTLRPRFQFFHDLSDFTPRNHHNRHDPHFRAKMLAAGTDNVEAALRGCAGFITATQREWSQSVVIESNHDTAFARWLQSGDGRDDAENAYFWHRWNANWHDSIKAGEEGYNVFDAALRTLGTDSLRDVVFVPEGQSFTICQAYTPIECGLHGHNGPNGSRGSIQAFARIAPKANIGHGHTPGVVEGAYMAGISGRLDQGYNVNGPTSWAHADIITYPTGKRTIVTKIDGRWRGGL